MGKRRSFDELYPAKPTYRRYNPVEAGKQRREVDPDIPMTSYNSDENKVKRINANIPGYDVLSYAYKEAADTYSNYGGNSGYLSWTPLNAHLPEGAEPWKGSPAEAAKVVTKAARYFGATSVGFTTLDKRWIYTHNHDGKEIKFEDVEEAYVTDDRMVIPKSHRYVVAITVPMEYTENRYAPTPLEVTSNMGYSRMHVTCGTVAEFIRGLGYHAVPCGNDTAASVPIAIQAGLGHVGRFGRLLTWERGPLVRICKIFTDLPLEQSPLADDALIRFCEDCTRCADECPVKAIPDGPRTYEAVSPLNNPGVLKWYCREELCSDYWHEVGTGCSICFRVCPLTKPPGSLFFKAMKLSIRHLPALNRFWVWLDEALGYGTMSKPEEYWNNPYKRENSG